MHLSVAIHSSQNYRDRPSPLRGCRGATFPPSAPRDRNRRKKLHPVANRPSKIYRDHHQSLEGVQGSDAPRHPRHTTEIAAAKAASR